jgi:8-oxo-dGTP pyrophosphatase MutT (NUDIX family)
MPPGDRRQYPGARAAGARGIRARLAGSAGIWAYRLALLVLRAWWAVRRPRSEGVRCVLRHGDAFVLVRHTYGDERWMLPGGRVRRGEDPVETAVREMTQELGVTCESWRRVGYLAARDGYLRRSREEPCRRHATHFVEARVDSPTLRPRGAELHEAGWFTIEEIPSDCSEALEVALANAWLK